MAKIKIQTAEELIRAQFCEGEFEEIMEHLNSSIELSIVRAMKEFAKLHVEAALKAAFEDAPCGSSTDIVTCEELHKAIMNSYPLDNIK